MPIALLLQQEKPSTPKQEVVMKSTLANALILLVVASGTALLSFLDVTALGLAPLETLFLVFVAVIIAIQIVPAIMLFGAMLKGIFSGAAKRSEL
jgi:hypothetical protein